MPYSIHMQSGMHIVTNKETGKVHGKHDTHEKAMKQMRLLHGVEHGMKVRK